MSTRDYSEEIKRFRTLLKKGNKIRFLGVGGVGMYSLFSYYKGLGYAVSGSDREKSKFVASLIEGGEEIYIDNGKESVGELDLIVYSAAIGKGDPELSLAEKLKIPTFVRAVALGSLILDYEKSIGVSGTHGKSTTSYMIYSILSAFTKTDGVIGAPFIDERPFAFTGGDTLVYEACEYKDSFLYFFPTLSVFLNLELDHTDYFKTTSDLLRSFSLAMQNAKTIIINGDDPLLKKAAQNVETRTVTVGASCGSDYRLISKTENRGKYAFSVEEGGGRVTKISLGLIGEHQVTNALCAFAAAREFGVPADLIKSVLENLPPLSRRLEYLGDYMGRRVYYDYAHHPTEIASGIRAISESDACPTVIFKPHTYSRTRSLMDGFAAALSKARRALILDIDGIREENESGVSSEELIKKIGNTATRVTENDFLSYIGEENEPIIVMGAANMETIKEKLKG